MLKSKPKTLLFQLFTIKTPKTMKKRNMYFLIFLLFLGNLLSAQNLQMKKWVLNNQIVDFTVDPPEVRSGLPAFQTKKGVDQLKINTF